MGSGEKFEDDCENIGLGCALEVFRSTPFDFLYTLLTFKFKTARRLDQQPTKTKTTFSGTSVEYFLSCFGGFIF
jgi:hypothetical protein